MVDPTATGVDDAGDGQVRLIFPQAMNQAVVPSWEDFTWQGFSITPTFDSVGWENATTFLITLTGVSGVSGDEYVSHNGGSVGSAFQTSELDDYGAFGPIHIVFS